MCVTFKDVVLGFGKLMGFVHLFLHCKDKLIEMIIIRLIDNENKLQLINNIKYPPGVI